MPPKNPWQDPNGLASWMRRINEAGEAQRRAREAQEMLQRQARKAQENADKPTHNKAPRYQKGLFSRLREREFGDERIPPAQEKADRPVHETDRKRQDATSAEDEKRSRLRTALLQAHFDYTTWKVFFIIRAGSFRHRLLTELSDDELRVFHTECATAPDQSRAVFENWLDHNRPGWRARWDAPRSHSRPRPSIPMSKDEALDVLGLRKGATAEAIRAAHKRIIKAVHPDHGGSNYLAARVNQAKDVLLHE